MPLCDGNLSVMRLTLGSFAEMAAERLRAPFSRLNEDLWGLEAEYLESAFQGELKLNSNEHLDVAAVFER